MQCPSQLTKGMAILAFAAISFAARPVPTAPVHVALTATAWTPVQLPARAVRLTVHDNQIWACGEHGMIAVSADGGRNWKIRRFGGADELLFTIAFAPDGTGYAWGSDGLSLRSRDGGATWDAIARPPVLIQYAHFPDAQHGVANTKHWFAMTRDGGTTWRALTLSDPKAPSGNPASIVSAAESDASHAAVLLTAPDKKHGQLLSVTRDGGKTWKSLRFSPRLHMQMLQGAAGVYNIWACKSAEEGKAPCQTIHMVSMDGLDWTPLPEAMPALGDCYSQGCRIQDDRALRWKVSGSDVIQFPEHPYEFFGWAAANGGICVLDRELNCALSSQLSPAEAALPDPRPPVFEPDQGPRCKRCPDPEYPQTDGVIYQGEVTINGWINAQGILEDFYVRSSQAEALSREALAAVRRWRFKPAVRHGHPIAVPAQMDFTFHAP